MSNSIYKFIYFDVGNVLLKRVIDYEDLAAGILGIERELYDQHIEEFIENQNEEEKNEFNSMKSYEKMKEYFRKMHSRILEKLGKESNDEILENLFIARVAKYEVKEKDVISTLEELSKSFKMGILSNALPSRRFHELKDHNLEKFFDPVIFSMEVGFNKPQKEIFEIAIEKSKVRPREIVFIDDKEVNLDAAIDAGFGKGILMPHDMNIKSKYKKISSIKELLSLLN